MKITKEKLNQIIQEELSALAEEDAEIAAALMGKAGLPRSAQDTKVDRPDPVMPQDLGPEDAPGREDEELPEVSQQEAIDAFIEAFIKFPEEKRKNINAEIMGAEDTSENPSEDCLWNFFDTSFDDHLFKGEDIAFCELARKSKFKIHANIDSTTIHHGPYGYKGKFRDALEKVT